MENSTQDTEAWGIVSLMGHKRVAGRISEQTMGGAAFTRVDVPEIPGTEAHTVLYGGAAIYSIEFTTQSIAESVARKLINQPVTIYDLDPDTRRRMAALPAIGVERKSDIMIDPKELDDEGDDDPSDPHDFEDSALDMD